MSVNSNSKPINPMRNPHIVAKWKPLWEKMPKKMDMGGSDERIASTDSVILPFIQARGTQRKPVDLQKFCEAAQ